MPTFGTEYGLLTTGHRYIVFRAVGDADPTEVEVANLVLEELLASSVVDVFSRYTIRGAAADSAAWSEELDISEELQEVVKETISDLETEKEGAAFDDIVSQTEYHPDEVEDAVQALLRGGQVYEPSDDVLRTI
jgi:DNA replicative helicase MCM subunit Mcm2 (Cdc46/Mcm family)